MCVEIKLFCGVVNASVCPVLGEVSGGTAASVETELLGKVLDTRVETVVCQDSATGVACFELGLLGGIVDS